MCDLTGHLPNKFVCLAACCLTAGVFFTAHTMFGNEARQLPATHRDLSSAAHAGAEPSGCLVECRVIALWVDVASIANDDTDDRLKIVLPVCFKTYARTDSCSFPAPGISPGILDDFLTLNELRVRLQL